MTGSKSPNKHRVDVLQKRGRNHERSQSIHGENARPTESPLQTFQNCVHRILLHSKTHSQEARRKKNRTPWPLTSSIPRWNRKCGDRLKVRRVVRIDTSISFEVRRVENFWVFRFVVRLDWKECRGYSLVVENLEMWISMVFFRWAACDGEQWLDSHHRLGWLKNRVQLSDSAHCYCILCELHQAKKQ